MKLSLFTLTLLLAISAPTHAANKYWTDTARGYTVYYSGGTATSYFRPHARVPRYGTNITGVSWVWHKYRGNRIQTVKLCYRKPYQYYNYRCLNISDHQINFTSHFNGLYARGSFIMEIQLKGGYYPAYPGTKPEDIVRVYYSH